MRSTFYRLFSYLIIITFVAYWILIPLMTLPHVPKQQLIVSAFSTPAKWFVFNWRFFARPVTYHQRLYLVTRNEELITADTTELIAPITKNKQANIPFNQKENILDHFIHYYTANIYRNVIRLRSNTGNGFPAKPGTYDLERLRTEMQALREARPALLVLDRFCRTYIQQQYVYTGGLEYKYIITASTIPSFKTSSVAGQEIIIYDSGYRNY